MRARLLSRIDRALNALDRPAVIFLLLIPVLLQWVVPLVRSQFWLDETVTWWSTNLGLRELVVRCTFWPGSILYNSFILLLRSLGMHREWMLRLPSLIGVILAAAVLFDLARRWFSTRVALTAVVFFCAQPWVTFAAADARPYGLGLLVVVTATWLMLRWLETERLAYAILYGVAAALMLHFHMLFAAVLVFHFIFLIVAMPRKRTALLQAALGGAIVIALALPLLPQYLYAFSGRAAHTFSNPRSLWDLCRQLLPTVPIVVSAFAAALLPRWQPAERVPIQDKFIALAVLWAAVPLVLLFVAAKLSGSDLFVGRYALPYVPGIALCFGIVLDYLSTRLRTGLALLLFLLPTAISCLRGEFPSHTASGNWAAAIHFVDAENKSTLLPAMMRSPFPESDFFAWHTSKMNDSAIYAPLGYYASSASWSPLPVTFNEGAAQAIDHVIDHLIQTQTGHGLYFVEHAADGTTDAYRDYLHSRGKLEELRNFENIRVFRLSW